MRSKRLPAALVAVASVVAGAVLAAPAAAEVRVFACEPEWAALAQEVGGEDVAVRSATTAHQDAHHVRARPSLIAWVRRADLVVCSGADLEAGWLPVLLERGAPLAVQPGRPGHVMAADHLEAVDLPETLDRALGDLHPGGNPHFHLDPRNMLVLADVLAERLALIDPENAAAYDARRDAFAERWRPALAEWRARADRLAGMPVVVHHENWAHFLRWAGLERAAALEPVPGAPPTASHLARVLKRVEETGAKAILRAPFDPADAADWLAERTGLPVLAPPFTVGGREGVDDLFDLFDALLASLEEIGDRP